MVKIRWSSLTTLEKRTFLLHFIYSVIEGLILGIFILNEFIFLKSMGGGNLQIGFLFQFSVVVMLFLLFFNEFLRRTAQKKRLIKWVALLTRLPLILLFFFPRSTYSGSEGAMYHLMFLGIFLIYYLAVPIVVPTINLFLKTNYSHKNFGKLYSYATTANKLLMLVATFLFGILLDRDPYAFTYIYPVTGVLGMLSLFFLSAIPYEKIDPLPRSGFFASIGKSVANMYNILKRDKPYRDFEISFMLYGFAFMSTFAVITIFFDRELHLNYSSVAFYKNIFNVLAIILLPLFGSLIGRMDPRRFANYAFAAFIGYIFFVGFTKYFSVYTEVLGLRIYFSLLIGVMCNGLFMAMISLIWYIGSAYFSESSNAADYQSVHMSLTGIRALVSPLLGVLIYELAGFTITFLLAILALLGAVWVNTRSMKKSKMKVFDDIRRD